MTRRDRRRMTAWAAALLVLAGCAPLPGRTLDPVYLGSRGPAEGPAPVRDQWIGRYEDSRGSGEMIVQIRRTGPQLEGVWHLRTGGDGVITGSLSEGGTKMKFQVANQGGTCLVLLDGTGQISGSTWTATYSGRDCQGAIANGRFSLTKQ